MNIGQILGLSIVGGLGYYLWKQQESGVAAVVANVATGTSGNSGSVTSTTPASPALASFVNAMIDAKNSYGFTADMFNVDEWNWIMRNKFSVEGPDAANIPNYPDRTVKISATQYAALVTNKPVGLGATQYVSPREMYSITEVQS